MTARTNAARLPAQSSHEDQAALRLAAERPAALCTIVGIEGSFSRHLGAQIAFAEDGAYCGDLADGCLERELQTQARLAHGPTVLRYGQGSPFIDFRLPCGSGLDILIDPTPDRAALNATVALLDRREPAQLTLPVSQPRLLQHRAYIPRLRIAALGAGAETAELSKLCGAFGVEVAVAQADRGLAHDCPPEIMLDLWTAAVLLFHDHEWERTVLDWVLQSPAFYIGAIGGRAAREQRHTFLQEAGWTGKQIRRVKSPIGLIPHTRDARVLALSILAEVVAHYEALPRTHEQ